MDNFIEKILKHIAVFQRKYAIMILFIALILTGFLSIGIKDIKLESDFKSGFPDDIPIIKTNNLINDKFGGQDIVLILIQLDKNNINKNIPYDIRDPKIIQFISNLENNLKNELEIESVYSIGSLFQKSIPEDLSKVKNILKNIPQSNSFFNSDYSATFISVNTDVGSDQEKINELDKIIQANIDLSFKPAGVKTIVTGTPSVTSKILELLVSDAIYTLLLAAGIIFILLIIIEKSLSKALLIFIPLLLGVSWTLGTMGWFSIQLSIATVGIGAMILGLGVEYGAFFVERYKDERKSLSQLEALKITVSSIGSSIIGSGSTTIIGFLALTLSIVSFLRDLGITLALGIGFSLFIAIFINPSMIIIEENLVKWIRFGKKNINQGKLK